MRMYAIRHKPTGLYLPRINRRGSTHHEATAHLKGARLFHRDRDARGFLTLWLQGKQQAHEYQTFEGEYDVEFVTTPVPTRKRYEMEVVAFELNEVQS